MWNGGHQAGDGIGRHRGRTSGVDNDLAIPPDAHAVSALASFAQQGATANYNAYPPQFNVPGVYPSVAAADMDYHHHQPRGSHVAYGGTPQQHHLYYGHRLPYSNHSDSLPNRGYQQHGRRPPEEPANDRYDESETNQRTHGDTSHHQRSDIDSELEESAEEEEEDEDEDEQDNSQPPIQPQHPVPRGKPASITKVLAAARLQADVREQEEHNKNQDTESDEDEMEDKYVSESHQKVESDSTTKSRAKKKAKSKQSPDSSTQKKSRKKSTSGSDKKKIQTKSKLPNKLPTSMNKHREQVSHVDRNELLLNERAPLLTDAEYKNLEALMTQFCRVPLLAEFSRPVSLLHPELGPSYNKIVKHPVDVGHVCRGIRRRQYKNTRDVRLDMWRVFANCVNFHSHPNNKEAAPSFVSIALHLRDFFNHLWQEYMLPSDYSPSASSDTDSDDEGYDIIKAVRQTAFHKRAEDRRKRLENSGVLVLSKQFTRKKASLLQSFIDSGGCVDKLDKIPIFGKNDDERDMRTVVANLQRYQARLAEISDTPDLEYTLDSFYHDLKNCYTGERILEDNAVLKSRLRNRLDRFFWKQAVPLHEANSRGVTQSSIWGNIAATIWARESSKKAYWPALCLGILPPAEQREGWHDAITERNEARLPEKLRAQLMTAKLRCEAAQKRQSLSYFLVEFLGTHEFIWVRETDIIENFDPKEDPNKNAKISSKKSRSARNNASNVIGSRIYQTAIEECVWAYEEYENVLQDVFEFNSDNEGEEDEEVINYSYPLLAQSDDEADEADDHGYEYDEDTMSMSHVDEANWLITHNGTIDTTPTGRKNAKLRTQAMKKQASMKEKKEESSKKKPGKVKDHKVVREKKDGNDKKDRKGKKGSKKKEKKEKERRPGKGNRESREKESKEKDNKERRGEREKLEKQKLKIEKDDLRMREREEKKEQRDLEKRRKKRLRDREKSVRCEERKGKRRRSGVNYDSDDDERGLSRDKRARATAIAKAYLTRLAKEEDSRSLALSGVMTMPAAMVDSTGLLGMALAFRCAAGELNMPDDGEDQIAKSQPWTGIDTLTQKTSYERTENLEKQIELIEQEILRVRADAKLRKKLAEEYDLKHLETLREVEADDVAARQNHFRKRKKPAPRSVHGADESSEKDDEYSSPRHVPMDQIDDDVVGRGQAADDISHASEESWR